MAIKYYVLDTETTGVKDGFNEVTQISIIRCEDKVQLNKYIQAEHLDRVNPNALKYTGRTMQDLYKGSPKEDVVKLCNDFFAEDGGTPEERSIVGHNIWSFDKRFVHALWESCNKEFPANLWLDTLRYVKGYAKSKGEQKGSFKLEASLEYLDLKPRSGAHNAVVDTQNNYLLFQELKRREVPSLPFIKRAVHVIE